MARPRKQTVDYFPHMCSHKKTMYILEQRYGNDGYSFWFKLLEMLGSYEGHYIDFNDVGDWEFLQSKTRLSEDICQEILDLLAKLEAIDKESWEHRIVWSQNFVDGLAPVYTNRRQPLPKKPSFYKQKHTCADVSTGEKPQSRVEEVKESRVEGGEEISAVVVTFKDVVKTFSDNIHPITPAEAEGLQVWLNDGMEAEVIIYAIKQAAKASKFNANYINGILLNLHSEGINTITGVEARERARIQSKQKRRTPEGEPKPRAPAPKPTPEEEKRAAELQATIKKLEEGMGMP